jgi:PAS domain
MPRRAEELTENPTLQALLFERGVDASYEERCAPTVCECMYLGLGRCVGEHNVELGQLNNDLANLLDAIRIPILFIGADLRVRRFTSAATEVFDCFHPI